MHPPPNLDRYTAITRKAKDLAYVAGYDPYARDISSNAPGIEGLGGHRLYPRNWHRYIALAAAIIDAQ